MILINFSPRVSNFIDAADVSGNIKNSSLNLQYINQIDNACVKAGIATGAVYPFIGGHADSHKFNFLDPRNLDAAFRLTYLGTINHSTNGVTATNSTENWINTFYIQPNNIGTICAYNTSMTGFTIGSLRGSNPFNTFQLHASNIEIGHSVSENRSGATLYNPLTNRQTGVHLATNNGTNSNIYIRSNLVIGRTSITTGISGGNVAILGRTINSTNIENVFSEKGIIGFCMLSPQPLTDVLSKAFSHDIYVAQRSIGRA